MASKNKKRKNKKNKLKVENFTPSAVNENELGQETADEPQNSELKESLKRERFDLDSDTEDQPKKKKKKKQPPSSDTSDKKGKKSIRQMKREKFAQRQAESVAAAQDHTKSQCLSYLSQWKYDRSNWKFMKAKQVWLYKNKFSSDLIPDISWPILLEYFESAQGNIRNLLLEDAQNIIKKVDDWTESQSIYKDSKDDCEIAVKESVEENISSEIQKPNSSTYKRARDLIQCLLE